MRQLAEQRVHVRLMIRRDLPDILSIEKTLGFAWKEEDFLHCLRQRNMIGMVAERGEGVNVVGFMIYELRRSYFELIRLAIDVRHRRLLVGASMIAKLVSKLSSRRRTRIVSDVRETNLTAQLFLKSQGFRAVRVLRRHFDDEDAFRMIYRI